MQDIKCEHLTTNAGKNMKQTEIINLTTDKNYKRSRTYSNLNYYKLQKKTYKIQFNELTIIREMQSKSEWVWAP